MWLLTVLRLIPSVRAMRRVPKPSSFNRSRADTAPGSSIASLRSPSNCEGDDLSRSSPIKNPRGKLPTAGQFLLSPGGQFFMSPDTRNRSRMKVVLRAMRGADLFVHMGALSMNPEAELSRSASATTRSLRKEARDALDQQP